MTRGIFSVVALALIGTGAFADPPSQPTSQPDEKTVQEALQAYEKVSDAFVKADYDALAAGLADNLRPMLPKSRQTPEELAKLATTLREKKDDYGIPKTARLLAELRVAKPQPGTPSAKRATRKGMDIVQLNLPLTNTAEIAEKHGMQGSGGWTHDADGNLIVVMIYHDGAWFWNPFNW